MLVSARRSASDPALGPIPVGETEQDTTTGQGDPGQSQGMPPVGAVGGGG